MSARRTRTITVDQLARVEGEGGLTVTVRDGRVEDVQLRIFEPPRFFEAFLRGRGFAEAPDLTARICGICPIAYQMSAVHAIEEALGVRVTGALRDLRRLVYCGEWIESHTLHVYMLHAPDFLGFPDAVAMAREHRDAVQRGLALKKVGNAIVRVLGGREIHPVNVRVGGFYRVPTRAELAPLREELLRARDTAVETVRWVATFDVPDFEQAYELVALRHEDEYPFNEGRIVSSAGLDLAAADYESVFVEEHVAYSNALHSTIVGRGPYLVGPLARYALNFDRLSPLAQEAARAAGLGPVCRNPFRSIVVRAVEILWACDEAIRLIDGYEPPPAAHLDVPVRAATGAAATEAPRGLLYHRYRLDDAGTIVEAKIVPPTSQNQKMIEADLGRFVGAHLDLPHPELTWRCEQAIRNYDPCISCATHFLTLEVRDAAPVRASRGGTAPIRARVIGLGQAAAGDDGVGPAVLARLRAIAPPDVELVVIADPGALVELVQTPAPVVLVDALLGDPAGDVVDLDPDALAARSVSRLSTHGLEVGRAVALARIVAPQAVSPAIRVVGVTIAPPSVGVAGLSPLVAAAVPRAAARVLAVVEEARADVAAIPETPR